MKRFNIILIAFLILLSSCATTKTMADEQEGFTVKVKVSNLEDYSVFLAYSGVDGYKIDTGYVSKDGWLTFDGRVEEPVVANLGVRGNPKNLIVTDEGFIPGPNLDFMLSNDKITIEGDANAINEASVDGGVANGEWNQIKKKIDQLTSENWSLSKKIFSKEVSESEIDKLKQLQRENLKKEEQIKTNFIEANPNSLVSMYFLSTKINVLEVEDLKDMYRKLGGEFKESIYAKTIVSKIERVETTGIGKMAIPIDKKDIHGERIDWGALKGKYVLLDFWGSWCVPCRQSFPHLKELYSKYKGDGFEILGIALEQRESLEENKKAWKNAISEDGLPWLQVLDNEDRDRFDAVKAYGVTAFPTQILIDDEGKIIARFTGENADLDNKLKEIFRK